MQSLNPEHIDQTDGVLGEMNSMNLSLFCRRKIQMRFDGERENK